MQKRKTQQAGQSILEMCVAIPMLFLLIVNAVNFGGYIYAWISVVHATRSVSQYAVTGPAYLGFGSANGLASAPPANPVTVAIGDMTSLPATQTPTVTVCTGTSAAPTCSGMSDPESTSVITTVDISYRYCPFMPFWDFPNLGIHSTLPACNSNNTDGGLSVHRIAAMRMIQ